MSRPNASTSWMDKKNCAGKPTALFMPDKNGSMTAPRLKVAVAICNGCEVVEECLSYAIEKNIQIGVFGGLSTKQRRIEATKRRRVLAAS